MKTPLSLLTIQIDSNLLFREVLKVANQWCKKRGLKTFVKNTPTGGYKIIAIENKNDSRIS